MEMDPSTNVFSSKRPSKSKFSSIDIVAYSFWRRSTCWPFAKILWIPKSVLYLPKAKGGQWMVVLAK